MSANYYIVISPIKKRQLLDVTEIFKESQKEKACSVDYEHALFIE